MPTMMSANLVASTVGSDARPDLESVPGARVEHGFYLSLEPSVSQSSSSDPLASGVKDTPRNTSPYRAVRRVRNT